MLRAISTEIKYRIQKNEVEAVRVYDAALVLVCTLYIVT